MTSCFAQNYFEFAFRRVFTSGTSPAADQAVVNALSATAKASTMLDVFKSVVSQPAFLNKSFE